MDALDNPQAQSAPKAVRQPEPSATGKDWPSIEVSQRPDSFESGSVTSDATVTENEAATSICRRQSVRLWVFESICIFISFSSLLIIITVLNAFDGQPLPKLPMHMTLNTFLAFFTTFTKAAFMIPVVECISQWKWNWFAREQPVMHFNTFDNASRGVIGSVVLLKLLKWRHVAALGAFISVIGLGTTPITQLLIEYPSHSVPLAPSSKVPNATTHAVENYRSRVGLTGSWSLDISNYVSAALVHPADSRIKELDPTCPSGACTWEPFDSIGLCSKVANITDHISVTQVPFSVPSDWTAWDSTLDEDSLRLNGTLAYNISFPNSNGEHFVAPVSYTVYSSPVADSIAFGNDHALSQARVAGYKIVWADAGNVTYSNGNSTRSDPWRWQAFEILYHVCVNTYSVRVDDGVASTTVWSSSYDVITESTSSENTNTVQINCTAPRLVSGQAQFTDCTQNGRSTNLGVLTLRGSSTGRNYTADLRSLTLLGKYITQDSSGIWTWDGSEHMILAGNRGLPTLADAVYGYMYDDGMGGERGSMIGDGELQLERLQNVASNLAVSITNGIRSIGPYNSTQNSFPVLGTVLSPQVYIRVRWGWLTFLVLQLVASLILFVCTIISTARLGTIPTLKSSALATLFAFQQLCKDNRYQTLSTDEPCDGPQRDIQELKRGARQMVAKMEGGVMVVSRLGKATTTTSAGPRTESELDEATYAENTAREAVASEQKA